MWWSFTGTFVGIPNGESSPQHALTKVDEFRPDVAFILLVATSTYGDPKTRDASLTAGFE